MTIGEKIKAVRKSKGMTQRELAEKSGIIYDAAIRKYESNRQSPKKETIKKIAKALEINYYILLDDNEEIPKHAKWNINPDGYYPYCSCCKEEPPSGIMTKYCPNCGARMDLKE